MTWIQTSTGRAFDLLNPTPNMVDLKVDVPEALARIPRFNGHVLSGPYSVAQHSVIGADIIMSRTRDKALAAAFLLHDAHEAYLGDLTTPVVEALSEALAEITPASGKLFGLVLGHVKGRVDTAIYAAAGLKWPLPQRTRDLIEEIDVSLLRTERDALLGAPPERWAEQVEAAPRLRLGNKLKPQPWPDAAADFVDRLNRYCPPAHARAA